MSEPHPKRSSPPRNPGVRNLVSNLRLYHTPQTSEMAKTGFRGWHERGFHPHYDVPNVTQFVTFGLEDSIPPHAWEAIFAATDERERRKRLEATFDGSHGACHLRRPEVAELVENALRFFHGQRYELHAWCIMPNHVHVLLRVTNVPLSEIVDSWKSFASREANRLLGRSGQRFWRPDYFDIFQREVNQEIRTVRYIEQNPCKAKLVLDAKEWRWSSARLRDEFGRLNLESGAGKPSVRTAALQAAAASPAGHAPINSKIPLPTNALRPARPRSASAQILKPSPQ